MDSDKRWGSCISNNWWLPYSGRSSSNQKRIRSKMACSDIQNDRQWSENLTGSGWNGPRSQDQKRSASCVLGRLETCTNRSGNIWEKVNCLRRKIKCFAGSLAVFDVSFSMTTKCLFTVQQRTNLYFQFLPWDTSAGVTDRPINLNCLSLLCLPSLLYPPSLLLFS